MGDQTFGSLREWLAAAPTAESVDIEAARTALQEASPDLPFELGDIDEVIAAAVDPDAGWSLFVPISPVDVDGATCDVLVVHGDAEDVTTWDAIRDDPRYWLTPGSQLAGIDDMSEIPFAFDGDAWENTTFDFSFGEGDWTLLVDSNDEYFDLEGVLLRYSDVRIGPRAGTYIEIAEGGSSMTSGDIGVTVRVDDDGGAWSGVWGCDVTFHGRQPPDFSPYEYLPGPVGSVQRVSSDVFTRTQMRALVDFLADTCVNSFDPADVDVDSPEFSGTAAELIEATGGDGRRGLGDPAL